MLTNGLSLSEDTMQILMLNVHMTSNQRAAQEYLVSLSGSGRLTRKAHDAIVAYTETPTPRHPGQLVAIREQQDQEYSHVNERVVSFTTAFMRVVVPFLCAIHASCVSSVLRLTVWLASIRLPCGMWTTMQEYGRLGAQTIFSGAGSVWTTMQGSACLGAQTIFSGAGSVWTTMQDSACLGAQAIFSVWTTMQEYGRLGAQAIFSVWTTIQDSACLGAQTIISDAGSVWTTMQEYGRLGAQAIFSGAGSVWTLMQETTSLGTSIVKQALSPLWNDVVHDLSIAQEWVTPLWIPVARDLSSIWKFVSLAWDRVYAMRVAYLLEGAGCLILAVFCITVAMSLPVSKPLHDMCLHRCKPVYWPVGSTKRAFTGTRVFLSSFKRIGELAAPTRTLMARLSEIQVMRDMESARQERLAKLEAIQAMELARGSLDNGTATGVQNSTLYKDSWAAFSVDTTTGAIVIGGLLVASVVFGAAAGYYAFAAVPVVAGAMEVAPALASVAAGLVEAVAGEAAGLAGAALVGAAATA